MQPLHHWLDHSNETKGKLVELVNSVKPHADEEARRQEGKGWFSGVSNLFQQRSDVAPKKEGGGSVGTFHSDHNEGTDAHNAG